MPYQIILFRVEKRGQPGGEYVLHILDLQFSRTNSSLPVSLHDKYKTKISKSVGQSTALYKLCSAILLTFGDLFCNLLQDLGENRREKMKNIEKKGNRKKMNILLPCGGLGLINVVPHNWPLAAALTLSLTYSLTLSL